MKTLWTILVLLFAVNVEAAILYVDNTAGCPGSGTNGAPYCNIQNAFNVVNPGDDIRIRSGNGTYATSQTLSRSGTNGNQIIVEPDAGAVFKLTADTTIQMASYITMQNLTCDGGLATFCIRAQANTSTSTGANVYGVQILNNTFKNWGGNATQASGAAGRNVLSIDGGYCGQRCPATVIGALVQGNTFDNNRQTSIAVSSSSGVIIQQNTFTNNKCGRDVDQAVNNVGIKIIGDGGPDPQPYGANIIRNNVMHDWEPFTSCGVPTTTGYGSWAGLWCDVANWNDTADGNTIYNIDQGNTDANTHASMGILVEAGCMQWTVSRNVVYNIGYFGIATRLVYNWAATKIWNNTVYNIGVRAIGVSGPADIKNNIVMGNGTNALISPSFAPGGVGFSIDYNLYFDTVYGQNQVGQWNADTAGPTSFSQWKTNCNCDSHASYNNPLFVNAGTDFHLQAGSYARGHGTDVGFGTDLGALPFSSGGQVTWTTDRGGSGTATGTGAGGSFSTWTASNVPLKAGITIFTATATDASGNHSSAGIPITFAPPFPGNTMAGAWDWMEGSGTSSTDHSGNGNTASMPNGPTLNGSGNLVLNGTNQYAIVSGSVNNSLNYTQSFTFDIWVNSRNFHTDYRSLIEKSSPYGSIYGLMASTSGYCGAGNVVGFVTVNGQSGPSYSVCDTSLPTGQPIHLALTYDGAALKLYRQGVLVQTTAASGYMEPSNSSLGIGAHPTGVQNFDGTISATRTYNYAIPVSFGSNTVPGAFPCTAQNFADNQKQPSVIGDMNCPIVAPVPPLTFQWSASATAVQMGPSSTAVSIGNIQ